MKTVQLISPIHLATNFTQELTRLNAEAQKLLGDLGLDFIYSL